MTITYRVPDQHTTLLPHGLDIGENALRRHTQFELAENAHPDQLCVMVMVPCDETNNAAGVIVFDQERDKPIMAGPFPLAHGAVIISKTMKGGVV